MPENEDKPLGQELYEKAMQYNWRTSQSPSNAMIARAALEQAAKAGHTKALRELAEMMFEGSGGAAEPERALGLKLSAALRGDQAALEELSDLLESYAESQVRMQDKQRAMDAAVQAQQAYQSFQWLSAYIQELSPLAHLSVGQA
jgi:TPR repeat protein